MQIKYDNHNNVIFLIPQQEIKSTHSENLITSVQQGDSKDTTKLVLSLLGTFIELAHKSMKTFQSSSVAIQKVEDDVVAITVATDENNFFIEDGYSFMELDFAAITDIMKSIEHNKSASSLIKDLSKSFKTYDLEENYDYCFHGIADTLDQVIEFAKSFRLKEDEEQIEVFKDERTGKYVIPFVSDSDILPSPYYEFLIIEDANPESFGSEEHMQLISTLGVLKNI